MSTPDYSSDNSSGTDDHGSYKELRKKQEWPEYQTVIQSDFKRKSELMKKPMEVVILKLLTSPHPHLELLQDHKDHILRTCSHYYAEMVELRMLFILSSTVKGRRVSVLLLALCQRP